MLETPTTTRRTGGGNDSGARDSRGEEGDNDTFAHSFRVVNLALWLPSDIEGEIRIRDLLK